MLKSDHQKKTKLMSSKSQNQLIRMPKSVDRNQTNWFQIGKYVLQSDRDHFFKVSKSINQNVKISCSQCQNHLINVLNSVYQNSRNHSSKYQNQLTNMSQIIVQNVKITSSNCWKTVYQNGKNHLLKAPKSVDQNAKITWSK